MTNEDLADFVLVVVTWQRRAANSTKGLQRGGVLSTADRPNIFLIKMDK